MNGFELVKTAASELRVIQQDENALTSALAVIIAGLFVVAGQKANANEIVSMSRILTNDLQTRFKTLTLKEVEYACNAGIRHDYGDYYGINVTSVNVWLKAYIASDEHKNVTTQRHQKPLPELPPRSGMTEIELENHAKVMFEFYKKYKYVIDAGNLVYNYLDKKELIPFTETEKQHALEIAKREIVLSKKESVKIALSAKDLLKEITPTSAEKESKRILLNKFFAALVENKIDLYGTSNGN
jgi:hypothetical protein